MDGITDGLVELSSDLLEYAEKAEQGLNNRGFEVSNYIGVLATDSCRYWEDEPETALEQLNEGLEKRIFLELQLEEPVAEHGEPKYNTQILIGNYEGELEANVNLQECFEVSEREQDRWKAEVEKSLYDQDLPVRK